MPETNPILKVEGKGPQNCCVMCCGCRQFLGKKGENIDIGLPTGGIISIGSLAAMFPKRDNPGVEDFLGPEAANAAALKAGWQVEDSEGANHRCPTCVEKERTARTPQRGAILRFEDGRILPEEIK